jgi:mono/diheme cytochrome c family protein
MVNRFFLIHGGSGSTREDRSERCEPLPACGPRALFLNSCAHCHGADARGDEGPDLHDLQVSDRYIANTIRRGIKGEMPSFARKHDDADISALLANERSLAPA